MAGKPAPSAQLSSGKEQTQAAPHSQREGEVLVEFGGQVWKGLPMPEELLVLCRSSGARQKYGTAECMGNPHTYTVALSRLLLA